jgi:glucose-6-phosphate dehydrogenase assembly protein OpcA
MATTVAERTWRPSKPDRIDADLAALWREIGRISPVSRAVLANLIVVCQRPAELAIDLSHPLAAPVDEVSRRHASRVIILQHDAATDLCRGPMAAAVAVLTIGAPPNRFGVEHIAVRSACAESSLPSILRRLMLGGVPTSIWWMEDFASARPLEAVVGMGRQLVYDSRPWTDVRASVEALRPLIVNRGGPALGDLNWRRLSPVRHAIAHALDAANAGAELAGAVIRCRPDEAALAWLLAGWVETWTKSENRPLTRLRVEEDAAQRERLTLTGGLFTLRLTAHAVDIGPRGAAPFVVAVPSRSNTEEVTSELGTLERDTALRDSLEALLDRFATSR